MDLARMVPGSIIIDNGSGDKFNIPNQVIRFKDNLGFTRNWNRAIKALWKEFEAFWLMNSDIVIDHNCIDRIQALMDTGLYDFLTPSFNSWMDQLRNHFTNGVRQVRCIELTAPVITRNTFKIAGMFDEHFNLGSGVDFEFSWRCMKKGIRMFADDGSCFRHIGHGTIKTIGTIQNYSNKANQEMDNGMRRIFGPDWKKKILPELWIFKNHKMKIAVYTTIFGGYDRLLAVPKQNIPANFFCITDAPSEIIEKDFKNTDESWKIIKAIQPRTDLHPRMRAKWYKIFPWEINQLNEYDIIIFLDGCIQINSAFFVEFCIQNLKTDIALFAHPERNCIYDEVKASEIMVKYRNEAIHEQAEYYKSFHPAGAGLYACTVIVRKPTTRVRALMMSWWHENIKFTWQDQLSLPVICRVHRIKPDILPGNLYDNAYFKRIHHADMKDQELIKAIAPNKKEMSRNAVMNWIIKTMGYKDYLEIGLRDGDTFYNINCENKKAVDPVIAHEKKPDFLMTSDNFFKMLTAGNYEWDMIFIDGDHNHEQVTWDLTNASRFIRKNGCIVMHDTNPKNERYTKEDRCGTAFRTLVDIMRMKDFGFELYTLTLPDDEGNGISIIFHGEATTRDPFPEIPTTEPHPYYDFKKFDANRKTIINDISLAAFKKIVEKKSKLKRQPKRNQ